MSTSNNAIPAELKNSNNNKIDNQTDDDIEVFLVLGAPGSGKGTLCPMLAPHLNCLHISVGDYLRELMTSPEITDESALGGLSFGQLTTLMDKRTLVPPAEIVAILKYKIELEKAKGHYCFLIDGFPRCLKSAELFDQITHPASVLYFDCPRDIAEKRFLNRKRADDDDTVVFVKRYAEFEANNPHLIKRYEEIVTFIDASGNPEDTKGKLLEALGLV